MEAQLLNIHSHVYIHHTYVQTRIPPVPCCTRWDSGVGIPLLWFPISGRLPHSQLAPDPWGVSYPLHLLISWIRTIKIFTGQMDGNPAGCRACSWVWLCRRSGEMMMSERWRPLEKLTGGTLAPSYGYRYTLVNVKCHLSISFLYFLNGYQHQIIHFEIIECSLFSFTPINESFFS